MVLLLDEADSFLQDRSHSQHSWEVTQVNELLVQMEDFDGLFIASTNIVDSLDMASLRRFDHKIKFDFMRPKQAWDLFTQVLEEHQQAQPKDTTAKDQLAQWPNLTPGDFATVIRQARSLDQALDSPTLLELLKKECEVKNGRSKPIGFVR